MTRTDTLKKHRWRKSTVDGQPDIEQSESSTVGKNHGKKIRQLIINFNQKIIFLSIQDDDARWLGIDR